MKISSKSILSPGRAGARARDPPTSLSTSLSRRLRTSGSIKGGASPAMFPTTGKKRGSGFENPEPSSPKVTCIGQVRVKSKKKQGKKSTTLSRRHSTREVSFRKLEHPHDVFSTNSPNHHESQNLGSNGSLNQEQRSNQRWVHLPLTICEAVRALGSEFSCLFPCRTSCFSTTEREKDDKTVAAATEESNRQGSCGVFARWLVALQDGGGGGGGGGERDIELVVGEQEDNLVRNPRRHVFEDLEIINDRIEGHKDEARMSICIPPKNALLLMRCRSDPMKMEALAQRSLDPTVPKNEDEDGDQIEEERVDLQEDQEDLQVEQQKEENVMDMDDHDDQEQDNEQQDEVDQDQDQEQEQEESEEEEESMFLGSLFEEIVNQYYEIQEEHEADSDMEEAREPTEEEGLEGIEAEELIMDEVNDFGEMVTKFAERSATHEEVVREAEEQHNEVLERESKVKDEGESQSVLPECLLMMLYEPKLSMEVSKETWVCSTDFIRRHSNSKKPPQPQPLRPVETDGGDESKVNVATAAAATTYNAMRVAEGRCQPVLQQLARSSCSLPGPSSMATMLEQKLVNAVGYEPFVLTRCKSEPMKTAVAKLVPETCFWDNRKLEPLSLGIGAAGLGF